MDDMTELVSNLPAYGDDPADFEQPYDESIDSPNDMLVDSEDLIVDADLNEKDDVININPDSDGEPLPRADDYDAMRKVALPPLHEQPETIAEGYHTWHIEQWRGSSRRNHGPVFEVGGFPWRVLMFPYGNNVDHASFYLEQGYPDSKPPDDYVCCAQFGLVLWNPNCPEVFTSHTAHHRFTKEEGDWGFTRFVELRKLWTNSWADTGRFLVENDEAMVTAYVRIVKDETGVLWHNFVNYDSKKETGYVGLKNQGATCYLNSLIQSLYFTNAFRKAVYQIPTSEEETLSNSAYTLQRLFYQLQTSDTAVGTNELTKSFGWETRHIFEQQDVQELSRKLMERMEEKMKGTAAENVLPNLFCGKVRTYISCINVEYESRRVEDFWDVQLNVSGNKSIEEGFKDYVQVETMDGENQYFAGDEFKLQDAKKGVIFESFPDVLHLQLKRFQYDIDHDAMMKVNDRYEFPETFDAEPYLSAEADRSEPWVYKLHSVLVHSGDLNAGHYYAFIKPTKDGWFYKYDDDKVTRATNREALEDNFGGEYQINGVTQMSATKTPIMRQNSAYMLVYIRETRQAQVLVPVIQEDIPPHLQRKLEEEAAMREARKKEREEQHLYLWAKVITDDTFKAHGGTDLTNFDANHDVDPAAPRAYRMLRKSTLRELIEKIAEDTSTDSKRIRLWCMVNRQNKTTRPDMPLHNVDYTLEEAHQKLVGAKTPELRMWAETAEDVDTQGIAVWPAHSGHQNGVHKSDLFLLYLKYFDVDNQQLSGVGHIYISREKKVEELVPAILKKMGWPEKSPTGERTVLKLFEEIKPNMIEPLKAKMSLRAAELQDGDIVCFQKFVESSNASETDHQSFKSIPSDGRADDARQFYDFLVHRRVVRFHAHPVRNANPEEYEPFSLVLSAKNSYDQMAAKVGEKLGVDGTHLRFWTVNATTNNPKAAVKRGPTQSLQTILNPPYSTFSNNNQRFDSLFFEVLEISLSELDTKKSITVYWLSEGVTKDEPVNVLVPKNGNAQDVVDALIKKAGLDDEETGGPIRLYELHNHRIHKEHTPPRNHSVISITDYVQLVAERIPKEDVDAQQNELIHAFHFQGEPSKTHGIPFEFRIMENEKFANTKKRLEKRTGLKGKNFEKIKFAIIRKGAYSKPTYLADEDVIWEVASQDDDMLGLDHIDRSRAVRNGAGDLFLK